MRRLEVSVGVATFGQTALCKTMVSRWPSGCCPTMIRQSRDVRLSFKASYLAYRILGAVDTALRARFLEASSSMIAPATKSRTITRAQLGRNP